MPALPWQTEMPLFASGENVPHLGALPSLQMVERIEEVGPAGVLRIAPQIRCEE
jgi:hypothetical protein